MNRDSSTRRQVRRRRRRGRSRLALSVVAVVAVFVPLGYVFGQFWTSTASSVDFVGSERRGVAYVRPLTRLLGVLVDAQSAAVRGAKVDAAAVSAAVQEVGRVDDALGIALGVRQRWSPMPGQIGAVLDRRTTGQEALRAYAGPVALIQALLGELGDRTKIVRDPELDAYHLIDAAVFRVPEVIVGAGQIAALAPRDVTGDTTVDPRIEVAHDRVVRATQAITVGLRTSADASTGATVDLNVLQPLDEFAAAVDSMTQLTTRLGDSSLASAGVDAAQRRVHKAAVTLESAVLVALDSLLEAREDALGQHRRNAAFAGLLALLAAAVLLWSRLPGPFGSPPVSMGESGPRGRLAGTEDPSGDLISARDLHQLVTAGNGVRTQRPRDVR